MLTKNHNYMLKALELAQKRRGFCAPNPSVGAVIVKEGQIIGEGSHFGCGHPHAEVEALKKAGAGAQSADIYITLEPCQHTGRTPPCIEALIKAGIQSVFYGMDDPNPLMAGKSRIRLADAGISCALLPMSEITDFYDSYRYWWRTKRPRVTAKLAMSLDGKIANPCGEPLTLTGAAAKQRTFEERQKADALLTTMRTIANDDPQFNVRLDGETIAKPLYVLDSRLEMKPSAKVFQTCASVTLLHGPAVDPTKLELFLRQGVHCHELSAEKNRLNLEEALQILGKEHHDVWLEAGGQCFSAFLSADLIDRALIYIAPQIVGQGLPGFVGDFSSTGQAKWSALGDDMLCELIMTKP